MSLTKFLHPPSICRLAATHTASHGTCVTLAPNRIVLWRYRAGAGRVKRKFGVVPNAVAYRLSAIPLTAVPSTPEADHALKRGSLKAHLLSSSHPMKSSGITFKLPLALLLIVLL